MLGDGFGDGRSFHLRIFGICRYMNRLAEAGHGSRKGLRHQRSVPSVKRPGTLQAHMEGDDRHAGTAGKHYRTGLGYVGGTKRAIHSECHGPARFNFAPRSQKRSKSAAAARAAHRTVAEFLNDARDAFAIEAQAGENSNIIIAELIAGDHQALMPECPHHWSGTGIDSTALFA